MSDKDDEAVANYLAKNESDMAVFDSLPEELRRTVANMRFGFRDDVNSIARLLRMGYTIPQIKQMIKQMEREFHAQGVAKGHIMKQDVK